MPSVHQSRNQVAMSRNTQKNLFYLLLILPALILLIVIIFWPFLNVFWISAQSKHLLRETSEFVGLKNITRVLTSPRFWKAFTVDVIFTAGAVGLSAFFGLWISLLLHQKLPFRNVARGLILFPYIVPTIVSVLVWRYMFNDLYGVLNYALSIVGIDAAGWLSTPRTALSAVILVATWKYFPFYVIALLARLQVIPVELYESARIDGANVFQCFQYITWPSILPIFLLTTILRIIWTFNKFDIIYLLTGGGPGDSTTTLPILIYNKAFLEYNLGEAAAMALVMFVFLGIIGLLYNLANNIVFIVEKKDVAILINCH